MTALTLHAHEIRRLLSHGSVLVVRPVKPQPHWNPPETIPGFWYWEVEPGKWYCYRDDEIAEIHEYCPLGAPGERRWVRETWRRSLPSMPNGLEYQADGLLRWFDGSDTVAEYESVTIHRDGRWRSPATMPRWASRCDVTVRDVRVVRVDDVGNDMSVEAGHMTTWEEQGWAITGRGNFIGWWNARHGKQYPYADRPWAWAVTVKRTPDSPAKEE